MEKVAVFIKKYSIGKSSPVICLLDMLSDNFQVDLFLEEVWYTNATVLKKKTINQIEPGERQGYTVWQKITKKIGMYFGWDSTKNSLRFSENYKAYICFDPHGFILCKELFPDARAFYYSLELCFVNDHFNMDYPEEIMRKEREEINTVRGLIIQSHERELLFRKDYNLSNQVPALILPVTYLQPSVKEKSPLLRDKFKIGEDKKIALHLGGIQEYFSCIELALAFSQIDDWVLVFHGYYFGDYIEKLRTTLEQKSIKNVFISDEAYEQIEAMDPLLMSCDIGIAWYNNVSLNFSTAGKSSGKISSYLRFGLPVIAKKYKSTAEAIEETGCGLCVDDFDEIKDAVSKIKMNYEYYSDNCRKEYDKVYWFENYKAGILEFLEN